MNLITKLKEYFQRESKWNLASNIFFAVLLVLLLIPSTRKEIVPCVHRLFLFSPSVLEEKDRPQLSENDWIWTLKNYEGNEVTLSDFKGKVIFLNMWATWCPPCIAEMPSLQQLYNDYQDKAEFIFLSDEKPAVVKAFLENKKMVIPAYQKIYRLPQTLNSENFPTTYIIDKQGKIVVSKIGTANWNSDTVRNLLDKLSSK